MKRVLVTALMASLLLGTGNASADTITGQQTTAPTTIVGRGMQYLVEAREKMWTQPRPFIFEATPKSAWLGSNLRVTLLARNRGGTALLLGRDGRSSVDFAGVRRSTRMALARMTFGNGIIQPYAQLGAGAWRRDIDLHWRGDQWFGAQGGGGVQVRLSDRWSLAYEADYGLWANPLPGLRGRPMAMRSTFMGLLVVLP